MRQKDDKSWKCGPQNLISNKTNLVGYILILDLPTKKRRDSYFLPLSIAMAALDLLLRDVVHDHL